MLNVAPDKDGSFDCEQVERLFEVGRWLEKYGESIYDVSGGPIKNGKWGGCTYKNNILYLHILEWNKNCAFLLKPKTKRFWLMQVVKVCPAGKCMILSVLSKH